jgi:PAS domain S-box-containing protein
MQKKNRHHQPQQKPGAEEEKKPERKQAAGLRQTARQKKTPPQKTSLKPKPGTKKPTLTDPLHDLSSLRQRAEALAKGGAVPLEELSGDETARLIHELQVHQIELELQNEELRHTQAELAETARKYSDLYDFAPIGYLTVNRAGKILEANLRASAILGVKRELLLGYYFPLRIVGEGDREKFRTVLRSFDQAEWQGEIIIRDGQGSWRTMFVDILFAEYDAGHEVRWVTLTDMTELTQAQEALQRAREELEERVEARTRELRDTVYQLQVEITERQRAEEKLRESEARFRALVTASSDVVFRMSPDGTELLAIYGRDFVPNLETPTRNWLQKYIYPDDQAKVMAAIQEAILNKSHVELENRVLRVDGSVGWAFARMVPLLDARGEIVEWFGAASDITERKRSREQLHFQSQLLDLVTDSVLAMDLEGNLLYVNDTACLNHGYSKEELLQKKIFDLVAPGEYRERSRKRIQRMQAGFPPEFFEGVNQRKDGSTYPVEVRGKLVHVDGREFYLGAARDITERQAAEQAVRESEERLRLAQQVAQIGTFDWDLQTGLNTWTPELEAIYGLPPGGFARNQKAWENLVHPDDRTTTLKFVERAFDTGEPIEGEWRIVWPDGSIRWIAGRWRVLQDDSGKPVRMTGVNIDITARKRAEKALQRLNEELEERVKERTADLQRTVELLQLEIEDRLEAEAKLQTSEAHFRSSFDQSPVGMVIVDLDFRFKQVNPAFCRISGYTAAELSSMAVPDIVHPDDLPKGLEEMGRFRNREIDKVRLEERNIRKDGTIIWIEASVNLIRDAEARPLYYLGIIQDVTARKQAEAALQESKQRLHYLTSQILTAQEQERQRIARDLHDEMGQSLMALKMQLNSFKRRVKRGQEDWAEFDQAIDFVNVITDQTRKICQSLRPTALENLGLNGALRELLTEFQKHHGLKVMERFADLSGLLSNEAQITVYRLFQECLTNAVRHGKATSVTVSSQEGEGAVCFSCADNGAGFDLAKARSRRRPGMGLAAMEERVRLLQGSFEITSTKGRGTRIDITLPTDKA